MIRALRDPLLCAVPLFAILYYLPILRWLLWLGDEGVVLNGAVRILDGRVLYRDFFEILPPGAFLIPAAWMTVFGSDFLSARTFSAAVIAAIATLLYLAARLASGNRALAALLALPWAVRVSIEANHHALTTAASMASGASLLLALDGARPRPAALCGAGLFAGIALTITHTRGAALCVAVMVVVLGMRGVRRCAPALAGMAIVPMAMVLYVATTGALVPAFDGLVRFPLTHYAAIQGVPFGRFATLADAAVVAFFPLTFVLATVGVAVARAALWRQPRFHACLALAIVGVLGAFPRPDTPHLAYVAPLAAPLFALVLADLLGRLPSRMATAAAALLILLALGQLGYAAGLRASVLARPTTLIATARGVVEHPPSPWVRDLSALVARIERTGASDGFFFYPYAPMLPYLTARRHVAVLDVLTPGYTTPEQFRSTCIGVVRDAQWVVIDRRGTDAAALRFAFPRLADPDPPERRAFERVVAGAFETVHASAFFELRRRRPSGPSPAVCDAIGAPG